MHIYRLLVVRSVSLFLRNRLPAHGIAVPVAGWVLAGGAVGEPVGAGAASPFLGGEGERPGRVLLRKGEEEAVVPLHSLSVDVSLVRQGLPGAGQNRAVPLPAQGHPPPLPVRRGTGGFERGPGPAAPPRR